MRAMSIGAIISTPQGLAVVTQVLPTQFKVGSQTLSQVVAAPLGGGGVYAPPAAEGSLAATIDSLIAGQPAAAVVTSMVDPPPPSLGVGVSFATDAGNAGGAAAVSDSPTAYGTIPAGVFQAASAAYATAAALLAMDSKPKISVSG